MCVKPDLSVNVCARNSLPAAGTVRGAEVGGINGGQAGEPTELGVGGEKDTRGRPGLGNKRT